MSRQIIKYESRNGFVNHMRPMLSVVPDWYKKTKRWVFDSKGQEWPGVKHCIPFLESLTLGYTIVLEESVYVQKTENGVVIRYNNPKEPVVSNRPSVVTDPSPVPEGYEDEHFLWYANISVRPPDGYSLLYTHPLNRWELPFLTSSAVIDDYIMPGANMSFFIKKGFEGEIPAGTPIVQVIPFKREDWVAKSTKGLWDKADATVKAPISELLNGHYRKNFWKKKMYK